ncbi:LysR family transcriptional regulator [Cereibacter sphaeroides]|nr:LysR family transcriptional regulator [Cereibacter sphaeroides]
MTDNPTPRRDLTNRLLQLDIKHLVAFEAIYSTRNLSRAAKMVGFAQPTMSNLLARLRDVLEDPLFQRRGGEMAPTPRADKLIGGVRRILQEVGAITDPLASFDPTSDSREFKLHILDLFETLVMPGLLRDAAAFPGVTYRLLTASRTPIRDALESGEADLAIGMPPPNDPALSWQSLLPIEVVAIARVGHPEINGGLTQEQFRRIGHVTIDMTPGVLANAGNLRPASRIERHDVVQVSRPGSVIELVAQSDLIGLAHPAQVEASPYRDQLQVFAMPLPEFNQSFQMTWHRRNAEDPALVWLIGRIKAILRDEAAPSVRRTG